MLNEPRWVTPDELIALNQIVVSDTGEPHLLRDRGLLESATSVPRNRFAYDSGDDLVALACALPFAVARNHPFEQHNKRTAFLACDVTLRVNGFAIQVADDPAFADALVAVIERRAEEAAFAERLRPHVVPLG